MKTMKNGAPNRLRGALAASVLFSVALIVTPGAAYSGSLSDDPRDEYASGMGRKLGRGVANAGLGWTEIFKGMQDVSDKQGFLAGATWGPIHGTANAIRRTAVGVYETATFPIQNANSFEPLLDPEFPLATNTKN